MNNSIAFAKWFITKHSNSGIIVDGNDLQFLLSQLDQSSWDEFSAVNSAKDTVDNLIPLLVPPMTKSSVKQPKDAKKRAPKGKVAEVATEVAAEGGVIEKPLKEVKKRAPKVKVAEVVAEVAAEVAAENVAIDIPKQLKEVKEVKKRAPKGKVAEVATENVAENVAENDAIVKEVKKRGTKAKIDNNTGKTTPIDDVIVPIEPHFALDHIDDDELQEDLVLTEVFVDDVLFYTDANGVFYNQNYIIIDDPTK